MFRGDWKWFSVQLILGLMTLGLSSIVFMFIYNKLYIKKLIGEGFKGKSILDDDWAKANASIDTQIPLLEG